MSAIRLRSDSFVEEFQIIDKRSKLAIDDTDDSRSSNTEESDERLTKMTNAIKTVLEVLFYFADVVVF